MSRILIALDGSGSMVGRPLQIGSLFAATLLKANDADVLLFSNDAQYVTLNKRDSTLSLAKWLQGQAQAAAIWVQSKMVQSRHGDALNLFHFPVQRGHCLNNGADI